METNDLDQLCDEDCSFESVDENTEYTNNLSVAHVNIRSLVPSYHEIYDLITERKYSILAVTETWLSPDYPDALLNIPGYQFYRVDRPSRGGGVGVFVADDLKCEMVDLSVINVNAVQVEQLWLRFVVKNKKMY